MRLSSLLPGAVVVPIRRMTSRHFGASCRRNRLAALVLASFSLAAGAQWRTPTPQDKTADSAAFEGIAQVIGENFSDVQSVVVAVKGHMAFQYDRDGDPGALRDVQSVAKSALAVVVGMALHEGRIKSLDQPVVELIPELLPLNADPKSRDITLRHLLTMTAGFQVNDPAGTARAGTLRESWARLLTSPPGQTFAYDNAVPDILAAALGKAVGMPAADYVRQQLVGPLGMAEPSYERGLRVRTQDMARLGQLMLQNGRWGDRQLLAASYVEEATTVRNAGGVPVSLPYGFMWWVAPSKAPRPTFLASGYGGQFIWVYPDMGAVIAVTSTVSSDGVRRGQALKLMRTHLYAAAQKRAATGDR